MPYKQNIRFLRDFSMTFVIVLIVSVIVSYLYSLIVHGLGVVNWESSIQFALIFGIIFPLMDIWDKKNQNSGT